MPVDVLQTPLMRFLHANNSSYHGKARELREAVAGWLSYIPATFPNYTKHTIEHSEEIISQMSKLLFENGNPQKPVLSDLSSIEAYILIAAAYLHDAGMTVSDAEKRTILQSAEWREWVENGSGATRFRDITTFRESKGGQLDDTTRTFLADVQLRFLIAEYVRRTHHLRGGDILAMYQSEMGRFGYDDPMLIQTIASVCVAHGLQQNELNDPERFPERRDLRDEQVNVRLLAVLLRLGDLLDMSYDRACPLLLNAASPIPADSLAHWTQYQRITHKMVAHDRIELIAACQNEEEHRFLHDWCAWLVAELDQARRLMVRATRHAEWEPPMASIDQASNNTITIKPAKGARYIPARWRFELDTKAVFDRLIYDALDTPWDFLRELIQNAADASRCQMFADITDRGGTVPAYPTQVEEKIRERYPIRITLGTTEVRNELSGETEQRQVLTVEDEGLGMDQDVIQRYLLQVGRSYYTTRDFRDTFGFVASSRFGIGFLSVFGVSDDVTIETFKPSSTNDPEPLKLRLTGPRSYLLTERGTRRRPGTSIQVVLRDAVEAGKVTELVQGWCVSLEFPVAVNDLGSKIEVRAEQAEDFEEHQPVIDNPDAHLVVRSFPIEREGVEGNLFVLAYIDSKGERWDMSREIQHRHLMHVRPMNIELPEPQILFHGINTAPPDEDEGYRSSGSSSIFSQRIDLRGERFSPSLARSKSRFEVDFAEVDSRWNELLRIHFDTVTNLGKTPLWYYKQALCSYVGSEYFWLNEPDMVPIRFNGEFRTATIKDIADIHTIVIYIPVAYDSPYTESKAKKKVPLPPVPTVDGTIMIDNEILGLSSFSLWQIFHLRKVASVELIDNFIICKWELCDIEREFNRLTAHIADFDSKFAAARMNKIDNTYGLSEFFLNISHPFGAWYVKAYDACKEEKFGLSRRSMSRINDGLRSYILRQDLSGNVLDNMLTQWAEIPDLPQELIPPFTKANADNFPTIGFNQKPVAH